MTKKVSYKIGDLLQVHWEDIITFGGWWELDKFNEGNNPHACVSNGYLTRQTDKVLVLSATKGINGTVEYNQSIAIPLGCITSIKRL